MLSPEYLLHISEGAEEVAEQLHAEIVKQIIERIMLRIERGDDYIFTATDKWRLQVLQDAGYLLEDIQKEIAKRTRLQEQEIKEAMEEAGVKALEYDDKIYQSAGLSPVPLTQSPALIRIMQRNYEATLVEWKNYTRTTAEAAQRAFISALDKAYALTASGAVSYTQAVKEAVNDIAGNGVVVTYPSGHKDTIETATLRAVRTGISQASGQIQIARMDEMGCDLVLVSSHLGARPTHEVWQGKVYSRTGNGYPDFISSTGYGTVEGLCGANCRHNFGPYFEGMENPFEQYDSEENRKVYELQQRQRELERRIRNTKREVMGKKAAVDACKDERLKFELDLEYQRKAALLQKQNKAYNDFCEENGLKRLSDRISIAKWDRQQAAAARGAAKRYDNSAKSIEKSSTSDIMQSGAASGALTDKNDPLYVKRDEHANKYYTSMRNSKKDNIVAAISKNTGFSPKSVSKVYDHVLLNEYELYSGRRTFEPDYDMAESFRRLREGKHIQEHDLIMLKHEYLEYGLMNKLGMSYKEAHNLTNKKYNYNEALNKFKSENGL